HRCGAEHGPRLHRQDLHHGHGGRTDRAAGHGLRRRRARPGRKRRLLCLDPDLWPDRAADRGAGAAASAAAGDVRPVARWAVGRLEPVGWVAAGLVLAGLPQVLSLFQVVQLTVFVIFAILALSLDFIWGIAGILSFGQAALFGIGGYVYGI